MDLKNPWTVVGCIVTNTIDNLPSAFGFKVSASLLPAWYNLEKWAKFRNRHVGSGGRVFSPHLTTRPPRFSNLAASLYNEQFLLNPTEINYSLNSLFMQAF